MGQVISASSGHWLALRLLAILTKYDMLVSHDTNWLETTHRCRIRSFSVLVKSYRIEAANEINNVLEWQNVNSTGAFFYQFLFMHLRF